METFIGNAINEMISEGVSVEFTKRHRTGKFGYNFFYDGQHPRYGKKVLFKIHFYNNTLEENYGVFIHEFCHFRQWKDKIPLWDDARTANVIFDDWIQGKTEFCTEEEVRIVQRLELDCDKRVLDMITEYDLPIDKDQYIKDSNGYILSYNVMFKTREFYITDAYSAPEVVIHVPTHHITEQELGDCSPEFQLAFLLKVHS